MVLLAGLVFFAGAVVGGVSGAMFVKHRFHLRPKDPRLAPQRIARAMQWKLDLTEEQARGVEAVLADRLEVLLECHRQVYPRIEAEMMLAQEEVAQLLTPEQASQWRRWFSRRFREHWRPPPRKDCDPPALD